MFATARQINYLQHLTDRAEYIKKRHPALIPDGLFHQVWDRTMTSSLASARIAYYSAILNKANESLYPRKKVAQNEDLPCD